MRTRSLQPPDLDDDEVLKMARQQSKLEDLAKWAGLTQGNRTPSLHLPHKSSIVVFFLKVNELFPTKKMSLAWLILGRHKIT
jgi:hypothetical protein